MAYPLGFEPSLTVLETDVLPLTLGIHIGGDGEIRTHGPICMSRQVSNLLPSATRPRHLKLVRPVGLEPTKAMTMSSPRPHSML